MTDTWLAEALADIRRIVALPDTDAYPALEAWLDRWQLAQEDPTMGDLLGDPDWERRELRAAIIRLTTAAGKEITGGRKVLDWHLTYLTTETARLHRDFPAAQEEMSDALQAVSLAVARKVIALQARREALPQRRAKQ